MKTLLISATSIEVAPFVGDSLGFPAIAEKCAPSFHRISDSLDLLITGLGQMQAGIHTARAFERTRYDRAINLGVAGSFRESIPTRTVVQVTDERLSDLGMETPKGYGSFMDTGFLGKDQPPFVDGAIPFPAFEHPVLQELPRVRSVTVNRVLEHEASIRYVVERYDPDIVNMEGAAIAYAAQIASVPCVSIRAISDRVGPRTQAGWDIKGGVAAVCAVVRRILTP